MSKLDLNIAPYRDDFVEQKKFYKILFRPGRSVQARELTQLQSILQNQIARFGGNIFKQGSQVLPPSETGKERACRYVPNIYYLKIPSTSSNLTATEDNIKNHWMNRTLVDDDGVKAQVVGYKHGGDWVRLYVQPLSASPKPGVSKSMFEKGTTVKSPILDDAGKETGGYLTATIFTTDYAVGKIGMITLQQSVYFYNENFILVDEQKLFLEPLNLEDDSKWNNLQSYKIGLEVKESIVTFADDESLLDNALGSPNYAAPGADRLTVEATLTKNLVGTEIANYIPLMTITNGIITDFPKNRIEYNQPEKELARRTYDESGNYSVTPFVAEVRPLINSGGNRGAFDSGLELSVGLKDDGIDGFEEAAKQKAISLAKEFFDITDITEVQDAAGNRRWYPGTSYDGSESTSFASLCEDRLGIVIEPGKAYVKGYEVQTYKRAIPYKKSKATTYQPVVDINTPLGTYMLITNVYGAIRVDQYDDIELHSHILDVDKTTQKTNNGNAPTSATRIGTARVAGMDLYYGASGSINAIYQLYIFDMKLDDGYSFSDVKSIHSATEGTFLANTSLQDTTTNPSLIFTGTVNKLSSAEVYNATHDGTAVNITKSRTTDDSGGIQSLNVTFNNTANKNAALAALTVGTAIKINEQYETLVTSVEDVPETSPAKVVSVTKEVAKKDATDSKKYNVSHTISQSSVVSVYSNNTLLSNSARYSAQELEKVSTNVTNKVYDLGVTVGGTFSPRAVYKRTEALDQTPSNPNILQVFRVNLSSNTPTLLVYGTDYTLSQTTDNTPDSAQTADQSIILTTALQSGEILRANFTANENVYSINGSAVIFSTAPASGQTISLSYSYTLQNAVKFTIKNIPDLAFDALQFPDGIKKSIQVTRKIKGIGTLWKSNLGEKIEEGDWVGIGSGDARKVYRVYSTPTNDNELNLDPDPTISSNAPWSNGAKMDYLVPEMLGETYSTNAGLVFRLPHTDVKTIRGGDKDFIDTNSIEITYTARRVHVTGETGGSIIITRNNSNEEFAEFSGSNYVLIDTSTGYWFKIYSKTSNGKNVGAMVDDVPSTFSAEIEVTNSQVTFYTNPDAENRIFVVMLPVIKNGLGAKEGKKTLIKGAAKTVTNPGREIGLGKTDVFRINSVTVEGKTDDKKNLYMLDDGQTDYYYGESKLILRPGSSAPAGTITINFDYFEHNEARDYFSVDSYPLGIQSDEITYDQIPAYYSKKYGAYDLRGCIDFRPTLDIKADGTYTTGSTKLNLSAYRETPIQDFSCTYHAYLARKDLLYIDEQGEIRVKYGEPSLTPEYPLDPIDSMVLYKMEAMPYTGTNEQVVMKMIDNRRYTMRDIGKIDRRVKSLEYYTSLNLLEKDTNELVVKDALGQDKFKHGFLVDPFNNIAVSDISHPDFTAAIDTHAGELKPRVVIDNIGLLEKAQVDEVVYGKMSASVARKALNYKLSDDIYTLNYDSVVYLDQPLCSRVMNINPYAVQSFIGTLKLSPWSDSWRETKVADPLIVQDSTAYNAARSNYNKNGERYDWGPIQKEWTGQELGKTKTLSGPENTKVITAGHSFPFNDGRYLDENGRWVNGTPRNGQTITVPPGYANAGAKVNYSIYGGARQRKTETPLIQKGYEYQTGIRNTIEDLGFSAPVSYGTKIVESQAAEFIRAKEVTFEGKNFFPSTRVYAFFDDRDVTAYCYPESDAYGSRKETSENVAHSTLPATLSLSFELNKISTSDAPSISTLMGDLTYSFIDAPSNGVTDSKLTGLVTLDQGTATVSAKVTGSTSELRAATLDNIADLQLNDTITGVTSGAIGKVIGVKSGTNNVIKYTTVNSVPFTSGEVVRLTNNEEVEAEETCAEIPDGATVKTFTILHTPIYVKNHPSWAVYRDSDDNPDVHILMQENTYSVTNKTIIFNTPVLNKHRIRVKYKYTGSNYQIVGGAASKIAGQGGKEYDVEFDIIPGTTPVVYVNGNVVARSAWSLNAQPKRIVFETAPGASAVVTVDYQTNVQTFNVDASPGTSPNKTGTLFTRELKVGSVLVFQGAAYQNLHGLVTKINSNTEAEVKLSSPTTITTETPCADILEVLNRRYSGKFVDISGSQNSTRNILNRAITKVEYDPAPSAGKNKLTFTFSDAVMMDPVASERVTVNIKKSQASKDSTKTAVTLKCDESGKIKGTFCIPDPNIEGNPKFRTGDRQFRLTTSPTNQNIASVSRADVGYSARGWIDIQRDTLVSIRQFRETTESVTKKGKNFRDVDNLPGWGEVCPMDPIAQSFTVSEKSGIFLTAVDVFFFSKDPNIPVRLQIRPLDDGGQPATTLIYETSVDAASVVTNEVDLVNGTITTTGSLTGIEGFNKGPWNTAPKDPKNTYQINSANFDAGKSTAVINSGEARSFTAYNGKVECAGDMIPTRIMFDYPIYLPGNNKNYCFVLLTDSIPAANSSVEGLKNTYQVYFAQTGKVTSHEDLATPVHRRKPLEADEVDINFKLGTTEMITSIEANGVLFKSQNGISWISDQTADLKFTLHKAKFDTSRSAEVAFVNASVPMEDLDLDPFQTIAGKSYVRVFHRNHNIPAGSKVEFNGITSSTDTLNGISTTSFMGYHTVLSPTLDTYLIQFLDVATASGRCGGGSVTATKHIRYEEMMIISNPIELPETELRWRISPTTTKAAYDTESVPYQNVGDFSFSLNQELSFPQSMQIASDQNEQDNLPAQTSSVYVYATLTSTNENISPVLDAQRLSMATKAVRLDSPIGTGAQVGNGLGKNINHEDFDRYQCLPTTVSPRVYTNEIKRTEALDPTASVLQGSLFFTDTKNVLTGRRFTNTDPKALDQPPRPDKVYGIGSFFTIELKVGDNIKASTSGETHKVVEIVSDTEITIDSEFDPPLEDHSILTKNPPYLRIKTTNSDIANHLSKLDVGKLLTITGCGARDFENKKILKVIYTPNATAVDPQLQTISNITAPCLCEIMVEHYLPDGVDAGFSNGNEISIVQMDRFTDEIAPMYGSNSSKYVSRKLVLAQPANTLKIMFDGCRPKNCEIELYYKTAAATDTEPFDLKNWTKLEYSIEENGVLTFATPAANENLNSFSSYEANVMGAEPFTIAQTKVVLRGENPANYCKIKNFRVLALEE